MVLRYIAYFWMKGSASGKAQDNMIEPLLACRFLTGFGLPAAVLNVRVCPVAVLLEASLEETCNKWFFLIIRRRQWSARLRD